VGIERRAEERRRSALAAARSRKLGTSIIAIAPNLGGGSTITMRPGEGHSFGNCNIELR
jgi:hypothetical protein